MTKGQPKCVAFFILVYIALVISRLIHTPHSSEHFLITRTPADSDFLSPADVLKSLCMLKSLKEAYKAVMIRQRNRAIQRLCKLLSTNTEAHVQASHRLRVENLIKYHKTNVVFKLSRSELRAVCASPFKQLLLHVTSHRRRRSRPLHCIKQSRAPQRRSWMCPPRGR